MLVGMALFTLALIIVVVLGMRAHVGDRFVHVRLSQISVENLWERDFYLRVENSFRNNFIWRSELISAKQWIDRNVFHTTPATDVYTGADGWMFFRPELSDYQKGGCSIRVRTQMRQLAQQLRDLEQALESLDKTLVFIVAPNKSTIYPEKVGLPRQRDQCKSSRYDLLVDFLAEAPLKHFVRLDTFLGEWKKERELYLRTDNHWNYHGAILASQALVRDLAPLNWKEVFPEIQLATHPEVGNLARILDETKPEEVPYATSLTYQPQRQRLPRMVLYHDSFMALPLEILQGSFERIDHFDLRYRTVQDSLGSLQAAKIVILEIVELELKTLSFYVHSLRSALSADHKGSW